MDMKNTQLTPLRITLLWAPRRVYCRTLAGATDRKAEVSWVVK